MAIRLLVILLTIYLITLIKADNEANKLVFKSDGTFKILHVSDIHYEIPYNSCEDIYPSQLPCSSKNSTDFLEWLIETEQPDLVVHTGDIIDWATYTAKEGMTEFYNVSYSMGVQWAASLGNHDDDSITMLNRSAVLEFITTLPGTLTEMGPVKSSYGNFILEIFATIDDISPAFRTYHFDSDDHDSSISEAQVSWYIDNAAKFAETSPAPALAFYHIPLTEYYTSTSEGIEYVGGYHEAICYQSVNSGIFDEFKNYDVIAGFCGHDHTNDFCVPYQGINLCYEGSAGFQAYGTQGYARRTRVTELRNFGKEVVSWKRLDTSIGEGAVVDVQTLWTADENTISTFQPIKSKATLEYINSLPRRFQKSSGRK